MCLSEGRKASLLGTYSVGGGLPWVSGLVATHKNQNRKTRGHSLFKNRLTSLVEGMLYEYKDAEQ